MPRSSERVNEAVSKRDAKIAQLLGNVEALKRIIFGGSEKSASKEDAFIEGRAPDIDAGNRATSAPERAPWVRPDGSQCSNSRYCPEMRRRYYGERLSRDHSNSATISHIAEPCQEPWSVARSSQLPMRLRVCRALSPSITYVSPWPHVGLPWRWQPATPLQRSPLDWRRSVNHLRTHRLKESSAACAKPSLNGG